MTAIVIIIRNNLKGIKKKKNFKQMPSVIESLMNVFMFKYTKIE